MFATDTYIDIFMKGYKNGTRLETYSAKRIDDHLTHSTPSCFLAPPPDGAPLRNERGEFQIRVYKESSLGYVKFILEEHYGLLIEREERHPPIEHSFEEESEQCPG